MITITGTQIGIIIGIITLLGTIFSVFFYFQKPQLALEKRVQSLEESNTEQDKEIQIIKNDHSKNTEIMQREMKDLTEAINSLNINVAKLETIIDERIPKGSPGLTPPGV